MADLGRMFIASEIKDEGFGEMPAGDYPCQVISSEVADTKSGTGRILKLRFQVLDGQYLDRQFFDQINIENQSPQAEEIGQKQLKRLMDACQIGTIQHSEELHHKPVIATLKIVKQEGYAAKNEVSNYKVYGSAKAAPQQRPLASQPSASQRQAPPSNVGAATMANTANTAGKANGSGNAPWRT